MFGFLNKKKSSGKPRAVAFVDYEHWYISLSKLHGVRPDIKKWRDEISSKYEVQDIIFFADFSNQTLRQEIPRIREVSNYIIETQNTASNHKKDFTDFIMLDHIYQKAINSPEIDTYILFSGDGHFNSVSNYLISQLGKKVGVYSVRGAFSNQLKNTASWWVEYPKNEDPMLETYRMILKNLKYLSDNKEKKSYPSFRGTVEAVSRVNRVKRKEVTEALRSMIKKQYINQEKTRIGDKSILTLAVDWKKCKKDGIYVEETH